MNLVGNGNASASGSNVIDGTETGELMSTLLWLYHGLTNAPNSVTLEHDTAAVIPADSISQEPSSSAGLSHSEPSDDDTSAPSSAPQDSAPTDGATNEDLQKLKKKLKKQRQRANRMSTILPSVPQAGPSAEAEPAALAEQNVEEVPVVMSEKRAGKQRAV